MRRTWLRVLESSLIVSICLVLFWCQSRSGQIRVTGFEFMAHYSGVFVRSRYPVQSEIRWEHAEGPSDETVKAGDTAEPGPNGQQQNPPQPSAPALSQNFAKQATSESLPTSPEKKTVWRIPAEPQAEDTVSSRRRISTPPIRAASHAQVARKVDTHSYRYAGGVTSPMLLEKFEPEYSEEARTAKYQGTVSLSVEVTPSGAPGEIKVVRVLGLGLDEKAVEAVKKWRFRPATVDGKPVSVYVSVEVNFRLI
jgi:TonB family protein